MHLPRPAEAPRETHLDRNAAGLFAELLEQAINARW